MLLPDIAGVVTRHAISATLNRLGAVQFSNGYETSAAGTTTTISAVVQPARPNDLQRLPEGQRQGAWYMCWRVGGDLLNRDRITYNGTVYQVEHRLDWVEAGNYASALAKQATVTGV